VTVTVFYNLYHLRKSIDSLNVSLDSTKDDDSRFNSRADSQDLTNFQPETKKNAHHSKNLSTPSPLVGLGHSRGPSNRVPSPGSPRVPQKGSSLFITSENAEKNTTGVRDSTKGLLLVNQANKTLPNGKISAQRPSEFGSFKEPKLLRIETNDNTLQKEIKVSPSPRSTIRLKRMKARKDKQKRVMRVVRRKITRLLYLVPPLGIIADVVLLALVVSQSSNTGNYSQSVEDERDMYDPAQDVGNYLQILLTILIQYYAYVPLPTWMQQRIPNFLKSTYAMTEGQ